MLLQVPPMVLGPRGVGFQPVGGPHEAATGPTTSNEVPPSSTTTTQLAEDPGPVNVFVGKLPPDLHDNYIRRLLEVRLKCNPSWLPSGF